MTTQTRNAAPLFLMAFLLLAPLVAFADGDAGEQENKITICHKGKTKVIDEKKWKKHKNHGDIKGACVEPTTEALNPGADIPTPPQATTPIGNCRKGRGSSHGKPRSLHEDVR